MSFKLQDGFQISHDDPGFGVWTDPRDGQEYPYKKIGTQTWMLTNLNYGGSSTQFVNASNSTSQADGHAWRYNNEANYLSWPFDRGALYMWNSLSWAVPEGWHIPSASELDTFKSWVQSKYGSSNGYPTKAIKTTTHWNTVKDGYGTQYPANGTDDFGFSLVASGYANCSSEGSTWYFYGSKDQYDSGSLSYIWISDPYNAQGGHKYWTVGGGYTSVYSWSYNGQTDQYVNRYACAVRLIQDAPAQSTEPEIESITVTLSGTPTDTKIPTEKAVKDYVDSQSGGMQNPMTTSGDIITGGASGTPGRLGIGTNGQVLTVSSGVPSWQTIPTQTGDHKVCTDGTDTAGYLEDKVEAGTNVSITKTAGKLVIASTDTGMLNPMTTSGDLIVGGTSGTPVRLVSGTTGQVLKVGSNGIGWEAESGQTLYLGAFDSRNRPQNATTGQFILDTDLGYILYRYGSAWINSNGTVYEGNVTPSGNTPVQWLANPMTSQGDLIVGGSSGTPSRLAPGSNGNVLTLSGGSPTWTAPAVQNGDHKIAVNSSDSSPDYLFNKIEAGTGISTSVSSGKVNIQVTNGVACIEAFKMADYNKNIIPTLCQNLNYLHLVRIAAPATMVCHYIGFFPTGGSHGKFILAVYDAETYLRVAQTGTISIGSTSYNGKVYWAGTVGSQPAGSNPFTLVGAKEYYLALYCTDHSTSYPLDITYAGRNIVDCNASNYVIQEISSKYYIGGTIPSMLPSPITSANLITDPELPWIAVK